MLPARVLHLASLIVCASAMSVSESQDRLKLWEGRWEANQLGWHQDNLHEALDQHGHLIIPSESRDPNTCTATNPVRVFFPLCGKTVDMAHLALKNDQVAQVYGIDGVKKSLEVFASDHPELGIKETASSSKMNRFVGNGITLLNGDFFTLTSEDTDGRFEAIFDRASLVAIDPPLRKDYVKVMSNVIAPGGRILLVVLERADDKGPPFSVDEATVRALYESEDWVESVRKLEEDGEKKFNENEARGFQSRYFLIQAK